MEHNALDNHPQHDVQLDPGHSFGVRAWSTIGGRRRGLTDHQLAAAIAAAGGPETVTVIPGDDQTDFAAAACSKEAGLVSLLELLGPADSDRPAPLEGCEVRLARLTVVGRSSWLGKYGEPAPSHRREG